MKRDVATADAAAAALAASRGGGPAVALVSVVGGDAASVGTRLLRFADGKVRGGTGDETLDAALAAHGAEALRRDAPLTSRLELPDGRRCSAYAEPHRAMDELMVVGAGHIAVPLTRLGAMVGFRVTVLDDRRGFAEPDRFPDAARVLTVDFADPFRDAVPGERTWVVLVTRAHRYDFDCLRRLLTLPLAPRYVGMIGSRRRVRAALGALLEAGVPRDRLESVSAPLGLDLGAETPEEIAVSIVAELVQLRRGGSGARLSRRERVLERLLPVEHSRGEDVNGG